MGKTKRVFLGKLPDFARCLKKKARIQWVGHNKAVPKIFFFFKIQLVINFEFRILDSKSIFKISIFTKNYLYFAILFKLKSVTSITYRKYINKMKYPSEYAE